MRTVEEQIKKLNDRVNALRMCNLIMSVFYSVSTIILWVRYQQMCVYCRQVVDANGQIISGLQQCLELLGQFLGVAL